MGALLAVASAACYGIVDVAGGLLSRRAHYLLVALLGQLGGLVLAAALSPVMAVSALRGVDLFWGGLSGVGTGLAMASLFRGIGRGAMSVVVPVSAVSGVTLPVIIGVAVLGDRPSLLAWVGFGLAVPALWLVARPDGSNEAGGSVLTPVAVDGFVAGGGVALQYLALAQASATAGVWPVAVGRATALVTVAVAFWPTWRAMRADGRAGVRRATVSRWVGAGAAATGALATVALICYQLATRTELVTVAVVLASLYPMVPVIVGLSVFHERLTIPRLCGLCGAGIAVVVLAVG